MVGPFPPVHHELRLVVGSNLRVYIPVCVGSIVLNWMSKITRQVYQPTLELILSLPPLLLSMVIKLPEPPKIDLRFLFLQV